LRRKKLCRKELVKNAVESLYSTAGIVEAVKSVILRLACIVKK
jgi:hypothetical protein